MCMPDIQEKYLFPEQAYLMHMPLWSVTFYMHLIFDIYIEDIHVV